MYYTFKQKDRPALTKISVLKSKIIVVVRKPFYWKIGTSTHFINLFELGNAPWFIFKSLLRRHAILFLFDLDIFVL